LKHIDPAQLHGIMDGCAGSLWAKKTEVKEQMQQSYMSELFRPASTEPHDSTDVHIGRSSAGGRAVRKPKKFDSDEEAEQPQWDVGDAHHISEERVQVVGIQAQSYRER
jgi:hypothetical protein